MRYGASLRKQIKKIEVTQHAKYTCGCKFLHSSAPLPSCERACGTPCRLRPARRRARRIPQRSCRAAARTLGPGGRTVKTGARHASWERGLQKSRLVTCAVVCAVCGKDAVKRSATGIWACKACRKVVAGGAYVMNTVCMYVCMMCAVHTCMYVQMYVDVLHVCACTHSATVRTHEWRCMRVWINAVIRNAHCTKGSPEVQMSSMCVKKKHREHAHAYAHTRRVSARATCCSMPVLDRWYGAGKTRKRDWRKNMLVLKSCLCRLWCCTGCALVYMLLVRTLDFSVVHAVVLRVPMCCLL